LRKNPQRGVELGFAAIIGYPKSGETGEASGRRKKKRFWELPVKDIPIYLVGRDQKGIN